MEKQEYKRGEAEALFHSKGLKTTGEGNVCLSDEKARDVAARADVRVAVSR